MLIQSNNDKKELAFEFEFHTKGPVMREVVCPWHEIVVKALNWHESMWTRLHRHVLGLQSTRRPILEKAWWRHQMETFSALLAICTGNSPVPQRPVICARINGWVHNGEAGDLRRHRVHYDVIVMCGCKSSSCYCLTTTPYNSPVRVRYWALLWIQIYGILGFGNVD